MKRVIRDLNREILIEWGFDYDGYYWVHPNYPFKLINSDTEGTYMVHVDDAPLGTTPEPVSNTSTLLNLVMAVSTIYVGSRIDQESTDIDTQVPKITELLKEYLSFDEDLLFKFVVGENGQGGITPGNEYTYTLLSGLEDDFVVGMEKFGSGVQEYRNVFCARECMCLRYLQDLFPGHIIISVEMKNIDMLAEENPFEPFYGSGLKF